MNHTFPDKQLIRLVRRCGFLKPNLNSVIRPDRMIGLEYEILKISVVEGTARKHRV